jgi:hypothetical protein
MFFFWFSSENVEVEHKDVTWSPSTAYKKHIKISLGYFITFKANQSHEWWKRKRHVDMQLCTTDITFEKMRHFEHGGHSIRTLHRTSLFTDGDVITELGFIIFKGKSRQSVASIISLGSILYYTTAWFRGLLFCKYCLTYKRLILKIH